MKKTSRMNFTNSILRGGIFLLMLSTTTISCDLFRKAETSKVPKKNTPKDDKTANVPNTGKVLVDTIRWRTDPNAKPPVTSSGQPPVVNTNPNSGNPNTGGNTGATFTPEALTLAVLLPFDSDKYVDGKNPPKSQFALDFYAGVKMALDSLSKQPMNLTVNVVDSRTDFNATAGRYEVSKANAILGPIERNDIPPAIAYSSRNNIPVISPYFPTGDIEGANPNFIQVKPSLKTHCFNIVQHIKSYHPDAQVVVAARSKENEIARFAFFDEAEKALSASKFEDWRIDDETNFNVDPYIDRSGRTTVFIIPSWNEAFVSGFLKRLNASPRRGQVVVYGMPQWIDFTALNTLYSSLNVNISSSTFIDGNAPEVQYFRSKFLGKYKKLPNSDAFLGYDCMLYFGKLMAQYGKNFPQYINSEQQSMLHTKFYFNPVYRNVPVGEDPNANISKVENSYVNILKFEGGAFRMGN